MEEIVAKSSHFLEMLCNHTVVRSSAACASILKDADDLVLSERGSSAPLVAPERCPDDVTQGARDVTQ